MENRKGTMPGTRPNRRDSGAFPAAGDYSRGKSASRAQASRAGKGETRTLTRAQRLERASARATEGPAGHHGSKRGKEVFSSRPTASKPTRHPARPHKGPGHRT